MNEPAAADRPLHPVALLLTFLRRAPEFVLGIPALAYFVADAGMEVVVLLAAAGLALSMCFAWLTWSRFRYGAGEEEFVIESGVLSRNRRAIPYERVQDVSITRPLLARLFGVAVIAIETGSGDKNEGLLDCVGLAEAERLRDLIRRRKSGMRQGEIAAERETEAEPALFAMGGGRLLLAGLFNFSLVFLAVLGAIAQNFGGWLPFDAMDLVDRIDGVRPVTAFNPYDYVAERGMEWARLFPIFWIVASVGGLLLVGMITGIVRSFVRDYGFLLTRTEAGLRRQRGLFTRTDVVIPLRRVQAAIFSTGPTRLLFGWKELALQSLGDDGKEGSNHVVIPLGRPTECAALLEQIALVLPPEPAGFVRPSPRFAVRRAFAYSVVVIAVFVGSIAAIGPIWLGLLALGPAIALAWLQWRHHGHLLADGELFVRHGVWRQRCSVMACAKVQSLTIRRGPIQRVLGLATLIVATAGASTLSPVAVIDLDARRARELRDALLDRAHGSWL